MRDIDRLLRDSLKAEGDGYEPANLDAAESRFMQKRGRRRLVRTGGAGLLATAAAVSVFALVQPEVVNDRDQGPQPAALRVADRYPVAAEPLSIGTAPDRIWIASRAAGVVSALDPTTGDMTEFELENASQVVTTGDVAWAGAPGGVIELRPSGSGSMIIDFPPRVVDMASGGTDGEVWLVTDSGCVVDVTDMAGKDLCAGPEGFHATDVASSGKETWLLDGATGDLHQLQARPGVNEGRGVVDGRAPIAIAPAGRYADLLLSTVGGRDVLWASGEGGKLLRLDLETGEKTTSDFAGDYIDLAEGYGAVWLLIGHEGSDRAELVRLAAATGEQVGPPLSLPGKPSDLAADESGVWVTLRESNEVVRVAEPDPAPAPVETTEATTSPEDDDDELERPLGPDDLVMVFSGTGRRGGMTYAMYGDGRTEPITAPIEADLYPAFTQALYSDGPAVVIERRDLKTLESDLLYVDVPTGDETELVPGSLPAISSNGQLAYWRMDEENPRLFIADIGTDLRDEIPLDGLPSAIEWDGRGRFVYVDQSAGHEDWRLIAYDSSGETGPFELDPGDNARYLAPSTRDPDSLHAIRIEWAGSVPEVGSIALVEMPWATFDPGRASQVVSLDGLGIDESAFLPENLRLEATGTLDALELRNGSVRWGIGEERSWILGFRTEAWLIKESGEIVELGEMFNGGLAISPELVEAMKS